MIRLSRVPIALLLAAVLWSLAGCADAVLTEQHAAPPTETAGLSGPAGDKANPRERPHKGRFTVHGDDIVVTFPSAVCPAGFSEVAFSGTGNGTHLGRFVGTQTHCQSGGVIVQAEATQTAANGDQVFASGEGSIVDNGDGTATVTIAYVITGGTGRFAGASGSYTATAVQDLATGDTEGTFAGGIAY